MVREVSGSSQKQINTVESKQIQSCSGSFRDVKKIFTSEDSKQLRILKSLVKTPDLEVYGLENASAAEIQSAYSGLIKKIFALQDKSTLADLMKFKETISGKDIKREIDSSINDVEVLIRRGESKGKTPLKTQEKLDEFEVEHVKSRKMAALKAKERSIKVEEEEMLIVEEFEMEDGEVPVKTQEKFEEFEVEHVKSRKMAALKAKERSIKVEEEEMLIVEEFEMEDGEVPVIRTIDNEQSEEDLEVQFIEEGDIQIDEEYDIEKDEYKVEHRPKKSKLKSVTVLEDLSDQLEVTEEP